MNRREFLKIASAAGTALAGEQSTRAQDQPTGAPAVVTAERLRPLMTSGVQVGDVTAERAIVWSRTDRPARMVVEYATRESFRDATPRRAVRRRSKTPTSPRASTSAACRPARRIFYRVRFDRPRRSGSAAASRSTGRFRTPPAGAPRDVTFAWSADTVGQGWGIDPELRRHAHVRDDARASTRTSSSTSATRSTPTSRSRPKCRSPTARVWQNLVTPAKSKVARDARRVPRQLPLQPARRAHAPLQRRGAACSRSGTITRCATTGIPASDLDGDPRYTEQERRAAGRAREAGVLRVRPDRARSRRSERVYRAIPLRPAARGVRARHAQLPRPELREPADRAAPRSRDSSARAARAG